MPKTQLNQVLPGQVGEDLRQIVLELFDRHLSEDGKSVQYEALAKDPLFHLFVRATAELQRVDIGPLSREERIAFFLNTYNVLIVHALALVGPAKNFFERCELLPYLSLKEQSVSSIYSCMVSYIETEGPRLDPT